MDPYIDPAALDEANPWHQAKLANLARADAAHAAMAPVVDALPSKVVLQTTDRCNLGCVMCQVPRDRKRASMDPGLMERVVDELFPTLIELHPTNVGEALVWPHFPALCGSMASYGVLLDLTTNGMLLDGRLLDSIEPVARDVKFSFDGAHASTFERIRQGASFERVCRNVRETARRLEGTRNGRAIVALQMTIMRSNVSELPDLVRLAADLGAGRVKAYHLFSFTPEMDRESIAGETDLWEPVIFDALRVGEQLGVDLLLAEPILRGAISEDLHPNVCHLPWHEAWIDLDGSILACHSHQGDVAGNILHEPFEAAWNGPFYQRLRQGWAEGRPGGSCAGCGMAWTKSAEHVPSPLDPESFLSPAARGDEQSPVRWSARMRPFDLAGRRGR